MTARVLVGNLGTPDDIAVAADGTIFVGDERAGTISAWSPATGRLTPVAKGLSHPEGIVALSGLLVVCEQGKNQLSRVDPTSGTTSLFRSLANPTRNAGVDGLAFDPIEPSIVVPDSPVGTLLRVSLDGAIETLITVTGAAQPPFIRPTGAFVRPDGSILVADENAGTVVLRRNDGTLQTLLTGLNGPDDVAGDADGNVYVNSLGDGALYRLGGATVTKLIAGLEAPHGLAVDLDGNLLVTDARAGGRLVKVFLH